MFFEGKRLMKQIYKTVQLTNTESFFKEEDLIVSKTDLKGRITYCNRGFMQIVDMSYKQLIGQNHHIIRHPDMPKAAFYNLWKTLQSGEEWFGFVKNITATGGFYWVFAYVTIDKRNGSPIGYYSVRRPAPRKVIPIIENLYTELNKIESSQGMKAANQYLQDLLKKQSVSYRDFVVNLYFEHSS